MRISTMARLKGAVILFAMLALASQYAFAQLPIETRDIRLQGATSGSFIRLSAGTVGANYSLTYPNAVGAGNGAFLFIVGSTGTDAQLAWSNAAAASGHIPVWDGNAIRWVGADDGLFPVWSLNGNTLPGNDRKLGSINEQPFDIVTKNTTRIRFDADGDVSINTLGTTDGATTTIGRESGHTTAIDGNTNITGATNINGSTGTAATNIGTGATAGKVEIGGGGNQTIDIGIGAANKLVALGSTNGSSSTLISSGSGNLTLRSPGGVTNLNDGVAVTTNINTGANTGAVNVATGAGAQAISIGTGTDAKTVALGSSDGASSTTIRSGSGNVTVNSGAGVVNINDGNSSATNINTGTNTASVNVATGAGAQTINLATGATGDKTVNVGAVAGASATNIVGGSGSVNVNTTAASGITNINTGTSTAQVNIGNTDGGTSFTGPLEMGTDPGANEEVLVSKGVNATPEWQNLNEAIGLRKVGNVTTAANATSQQVSNVTGLLATDAIIVTMQQSSGAIILAQVTAVVPATGPAVSDGSFTVTFSAAVPADTKLHYMVMRARN